MTYPGKILGGPGKLTQQNRNYVEYHQMQYFGPRSVPSIIILTAIEITWLPTIPSSVIVARSSVIITVATTIMIPRAVIVSPTPTATVVMIVVARVTGVIWAWVIEALT
ncbi:hypothetical protein B0F90DRAFT_878127 [Multifurca ochricompacta]|uniref:Uncharacterized protein n=1 Tax=Multifurca ochricompacta TaxID=376703 RepID=A0AAD4M2S4_9AGAM|nr:hypothetical protein B0F90DRAFT_878127 [Multifurca ochricompacta]